MELDLNADLGEGAGFDRDLMPLITSANVCCGEHAGSREEIRATLRLAAENGVAVGAHPGYPDREHFGRLERDYPREQLIDSITSQFRALESLAQDQGVRLRYVKPHGALYNQACRDERIAASVVEALGPFRLPVVALPASKLEAACQNRLPFIAEGFADRRYREDGSLVPRTQANALIHDASEAVIQAERLVRVQRVRTLCFHGDNPEAVAFARAVREALLLRGIVLQPFA